MLISAVIIARFLKADAEDSLNASTEKFINRFCKVEQLAQQLGITDTATIAALLHCSVNTVYSYRSRMRLRSLVPERDFEQRVQSIGLGDDAAELSGT